jgi:hydroxymethylglutaryl-CoA reductase (NADPH)
MLKSPPWKRSASTVKPSIRENIRLQLNNGDYLQPQEITADSPVSFPLRQVIEVHVRSRPLPRKKHKIGIVVQSKPFGKLKFEVEDAISATDDLVRIPRDPKDDYSEAAIKARQEFVGPVQQNGTQTYHHFSFDPQLIKGNIEHLTGVAQIPLGFAGPLTIKGEHAQGDFCSPGHDRRHAGSLLQPGHEGSKFVRRRDVQRYWRRHAARPRFCL